MYVVRPKKYLGQHFLKDENIASAIASSLTFHKAYRHLLEIGPGTGVLTRHLVNIPLDKLYLIEVDDESVRYLQQKLKDPQVELHSGDFLKLGALFFTNLPLGIIGNFPYNISSQIFFKILENYQQIPEIVCMVQKEVGQRLCADEGSKVYGILSVLLGAHYEREYLFTVPPEVFYPPPKVESSVIRFRLKENHSLPCDKKLFAKIVKQSFQNRRKTLRNALKQLNLPPGMVSETIFDLRAEQISIAGFIELVTKIEKQWKIQ
ncbi:MAG: ribosomal RNA small subunit methyltransferase A [Cyclobacteriaceae bacterium]|nr:ribosomal RNA small subunit methyltransferase A [Cyclobacteriaceae bacterium]